jgi:hypothetical protein
MLDSIIIPNISEGSQFHQPPHEPSWYAHQPPNTKLTMITNLKCKYRFAMRYFFEEREFIANAITTENHEAYIINGCILLILLLSNRLYRSRSDVL